MPRMTAECERVAPRAREAANKAPEASCVRHRDEQKGALGFPVGKVFLVLPKWSNDGCQATIDSSASVAKRYHSYRNR